MNVKRIENFERCVAEIDKEMSLLGPFSRKYLRLRMNLDLAGVRRTERITLNVRISEWPEQYKFCRDKFGNRLLGMDINWV